MVMINSIQHQCGRLHKHLRLVLKITSFFSHKNVVWSNLNLSDYLLYNYKLVKLLIN